MVVSTTIGCNSFIAFFAAFVERAAKLSACLKVVPAKQMEILEHKLAEARSQLEVQHKMLRENMKWEKKLNDRIRMLKEQVRLMGGHA